MVLQLIKYSLFYLSFILVLFKCLSYAQLWLQPLMYYSTSSSAAVSCLVQSVLNGLCLHAHGTINSALKNRTSNTAVIKSCQTWTCGGMTPPQMTRISGLFSFRSSLTSSGTRVLCPAASVLTPTQWTSASTACWATSRGVCSPEWTDKKKEPTHYSRGLWASGAIRSKQTFIGIFHIRYQPDFIIPHHL